MCSRRPVMAPWKIMEARHLFKYFVVLSILALLTPLESARGVAAGEDRAELNAFEAMLKQHHDPLPSTFELILKQMEKKREVVGQDSDTGGKGRRLRQLEPLRHWKDVLNEKLKADMMDHQSRFGRPFPGPDEITWGVRMPEFEPNGTTGMPLRGERAELVRRKLADDTPQQLGMQPPKLNSGPTVASLNGSHYRWDSIVAPEWVDWRKTAAATLVKDQRQCSSCWAITVADAISMMWAIRNGRGDRALPNYSDNPQRDPQFSRQGKLDASAQQICDCMVGDCCQGGWPEWALSYVAANGGLARWRDYPYYAEKTTCQLDQSQDTQIKMSGWELVPPGDVNALRAAVAQAPVIAFISAASVDFQVYSGGLFDGGCGEELDHVVLIVGYGTDPQYGPYWVIKNTWGTVWGDEGYMYLPATEGPGKCSITRVEALYPTYIAPEGDPCGYFPNPCGAGTCYKETVGGVKVARCACPNGTVENRQTTPPKCIRNDPCSANPNPCGPGTCTNLDDGSFECICPEGTIVGASANGAATCVSGGDGGVRTYMIIDGDTCQTVTWSFQISVKTFTSLNGWVDCSDLQASLPAGAVVAVGDDSAAVGCSRVYVVQPTDSCQSIAAAAGIALTTLQQQNPTLNCEFLLTGAELCLSQGGIESQDDARPTCKTSYVVTERASCSSLKGVFKLNDDSFATLNPGLDCNQPLLPGMSICLAFHESRKEINCTEWYRVQHGDKCPTIWLAANLTEAQFSYINPGIRCDYPHLQVGQTVCISAPGNVPAFANTIPYTVQAGDTLEMIFERLEDRCGSDASPRNIAIQNGLDESQPLVPGSTIQVPCSARTYRTCGCSAGRWWCGSDGVWYPSYCDVVCNFALPAATTCSNCKLACKARAGLPPAWGGCSSPCPWPQWNPLPANWNWFTSSPCTYYIKACQDWCSDSASTACKAQGDWSKWSINFNNCLSACRAGKC